MQLWKCSALILLTLSFTCVNASPPKTATAIFAGGCFWSMQHDFESMPGVIKTMVGYTGGGVPNPSYEQVSNGTTGHYEAIQVEYDPAVISYQKLLNFYWHDIDPTNPEGQFCDTGSEYRTAIFYLNNDQKSMAMASKGELANRFKIIATKIMPAGAFYPAEDYHQHYSDKNPVAYANYRLGCQRDGILYDVWRNR